MPGYTATWTNATSWVGTWSASTNTPPVVYYHADPLSPWIARARRFFLELAIEGYSLDFDGVGYWTQWQPASSAEDLPERTVQVRGLPSTRLMKLKIAWPEAVDRQGLEALLSSRE